MAAFPQRLVGKRIAIFVDYTFEDVEVMFPKYRLEGFSNFPLGSATVTCPSGAVVSVL